MPNYEPHPIDTSHIELPAELNLLIETLSAHNHDIWSQGRLGEGWTWGAQRDDLSKKHPDLVAYTDLTEAEKQYDRNSVVETLKAIVALGYRIEKP